MVAGAIAAGAFASTAFGCGGGDGAPTAALHPGALDWVRPAVVPPAWRALPLPSSPARLPMPPGWRAEHGDPGTRTAILRGPSGEIAGYLNATPRQGEESLENWSEFRVDHNREEGEREVRLLAAATGLRFRAGRGSCVLDSYRTVSGHRYREIACIVAGRAATTVVVGAAPPSRWEAEAPAIERAVAGFTT